MNCDEVKTLLPEFFADELDAKHLGQVREHLASCSLCAMEVKRIEPVWTVLNRVSEEEPPVHARRRFDAMLDAYAQGLNSAPKHGSLLQRLNQAIAGIWPSRPVFQVAVALIFLMLGLFSGRMTGTGKQAGDDVAGLRTEMLEMRQLLTVTLMNQASAIDRLQGVVMSRGISTQGSEIPTALIQRLNSDPNVSVRIAAVEALDQYRDLDWVRAELVASLSRQASPLVQVSLIELLTHMKEKKAAGVFRAIIDNEKTIKPVRETARIGLENLV